jgi:hypothetical protein
VSNALDVFRAQQAAIEETANHLKDVSQLLARLNDQLTKIAHDKDLRAVLQAELSWLNATERAISQVRAWRREESFRYWPGVVRRWVPALGFALLSAFATWVTRGSPNRSSLNSNRLEPVPSSGCSSSTG